jgi:gliding motility-associated-like protein
VYYYRCKWITDTIQIIESATSLSIINVITTDVSCNGGDNGFASVFVNGGAQPYSYLWNDVNIQTTPNVTTLTADTFIIAITDASLCTIYDTIIISEPEQLISNVNQSNISCYGFSDGILINTTIGGVLPYSVNWQGPNAYSSNLDSIADLGIGDYILTVTDNNSCTTNATLQITEPSPLSYIVSAVNPLCYNDENGIVTLEINGGTLPYDAIYGSGINSYPTTDSIIVSGLSAGNDTLFVMDANGCIESNFINLTNPLELQTSNITSVSATCYGYSDGVVVVEVVGGNIPYEYQLLDVNNNIIGSTAAVNGLSAGEYEFIINDLNNCIISVPVTILSPNEISINQEQSCYGTLAVDVVAAVGIYNIFWENQEDSVFIDNLTPGTYNVTVIDELGCTKVDSFTIDELFEYSVYDASCLSVLDGSIEIHSISGGYPPYELSVDGNVLANDVVSSYIINDLSASLHTISLIDDIGCTLVDTINVDYVGGYDCIDEPIIISPNSDGTNDNWHPIYDIDTEIEAIILNRWGEREFYYSGNSLVFEWDGLSTNGNKLPSTDYYYIIKFKDNNYPDKTGVITLIR